VAVLLVLPVHVTVASAQVSGRPARQVALTFDDLPVTSGRCDTAHVQSVTAKLTGILRARSLPAAGLVTPGGECTTPALLAETLAVWQAVGAVLGNHTTTHPDFNTTSIAAYLAGIDRAQRLIDDAVQTEGRWFRPPLLHMGDEPRKKNALTAHLVDNGYRVAPVTVDNQEWVYAAVYADARARDDETLARRVADAYVEHLAESMVFYERLSIDVFGREIPQVLLLHANLLNAEQLGRVVDMLSARGYDFVGMPDALRDPAYARVDTYIGPRGLSWLQRWALEDGIPIAPEPREASWVAAAFRASQQRSTAETAVREALQHYLEGHATGQSAHFDSVFHDVANLHWIANDSVRTRSGDAYIAGAPGLPAPDESRRRRRIAWVEVTGNTAVARIDLDYPGAWITDYMALLETDGEWRIVNKIYHVDRGEERAVPVRTPDPREEIGAASRAFSAAYVAGDTAAIRELYTVDAALLPPERDVHGRDAIVRYFAPARSRTNIAHAMTSQDLRISDDSAVDVGTWSNSWRVGEEPVREASGRYLVVWRLGTDGRWRIEYDMWHRAPGG
jgi:ketosteroid isomerase-like protein/peptidoglycan/xylan/chitin deacetylase (PgdA/CDA1 family)